MANKDGNDSILNTKQTTREKLIIRANRYLVYAHQIQYSQARPTQLRLPRETTRLDCSGLVAACMDFAGVMPKVDWRWTNTWIQIKFGREVTLAKAQPGDVVFYGPSKGNPHHEALYLGNGRVLSMGHFPMAVYPIDYRSDRIALRSFLPPTK